MKKLVKVVMLPTKDKSILYQYDGKNLYIGNYDICDPKDKDRVNQHLYITSNEAIKEGDWCFEMYNGDSKATTPNYTDENGNKWWLRKMNMNCSSNDPECRKVVATTDESLFYKWDTIDGIKTKFLPQIPQQFIEEYVKTNGIERVMLECFEIYIDKITKQQIKYFGFELDDAVEAGLVIPEKELFYTVDTSGCVILSPIKESWNKEEVEELLNNFSTFLQVKGFGTEKERNWIKENLK